MEKIELENRKGQKIVGVLEKPSGEVRGTAIIQHGYSGFKEQDHIQVMKNAFLEHGFTTFNFDGTNSFNESDGEFENATLGLHWEDFEDVVAWVCRQEWFVAPLALTGHSMGGYTAARYAEEHPEQVGYVVPVSPLVSGELSFEAHNSSDPGNLERWKEEGFKEIESASLPGVVKRMPWSMMEERLNHNLLPNAHQLTMPTLLIVGSEDASCPPHHIQQLFDAIPEGDKQLSIIEGAPHTPRTDEHLQELKDIMSDWLSKVS